MTDDVTAPMTSSRPSRSTDDHAGHDRPLIVAYACGDLDADEAGAARTLMDSCHRCAALVDEVRLLQASIATDLTAPRRPRDFRLSAEDAERLRAGPLTRLLRRLGGPGLAILQPLAGAAMAIGLVLVVATSALPGFGLGAGAGGALPAGASDTRQVEYGPAATGGPTGIGSEVIPDATLAPGAPAVNKDGIIDTPTQPTKQLALPSEPGLDPGLLAGLVLLVAGGAVFVARVAARRVAEDPLLR
jgi:anti-sigma factor RsiW